MGVGLYMVAPLPNCADERRPMSRDALFDVIRQIGEQYAVSLDPIVEQWFDAEAHEQTLYVYLYPCEENVEFTIRGDRVVCSAKTSTAGPGYHEALIHLLDALRERGGLEWLPPRPDDDTGGSDLDDDDSSIDETGYYGSRDRAALGAVMYQQLRAMSSVLLDYAKDDVKHLSLSMPLHAGVVTDDFAVSPMGRWTAEWFAATVDAEGDELRMRAVEFFPWHDFGLTARAIRNVGLTRLWVDTPWRPARSDNERDAMALTLACFDRARELDPSIPIPQREVDELRRLIDTPWEDATAPEPGLIGFRRGARSWPLAGHWHVTLPGYWFDDWEGENESTAVLWFGERTFRADTFSIGPQDQPPSADEVFAMLVRDDPVTRIRAAHDHLQAAVTEPIEQDDGDGSDPYWLMRAFIAGPGAGCIATLCYADPADRDWALQAVATVSVPPPRDD